MYTHTVVDYLKTDLADNCCHYGLNRKHRYIAGIGYCPEEAAESMDLGYGLVRLCLDTLEVAEHMYSFHTGFGTADMTVASSIRYHKSGSCQHSLSCVTRRIPR